MIADRRSYTSRGSGLVIAKNGVEVEIDRSQQRIRVSPLEARVSFECLLMVLSKPIFFILNKIVHFCILLEILLMLKLYVFEISIERNILNLGKNYFSTDVLINLFYSR